MSRTRPLSPDCSIHAPLFRSQGKMTQNGVVQSQSNTGYSLYPTLCPSVHPLRSHASVDARLHVDMPLRARASTQDTQASYKDAEVYLHKDQNGDLRGGALERPGSVSPARILREHSRAGIKGLHNVFTSFSAFTVSESAMSPSQETVPLSTNSVTYMEDLTSETQSQSHSDCPALSDPSSPMARHESSNVSTHSISTVPTEPVSASLQTYGLKDASDRMEIVHAGDDLRNFDLIAAAPEEAPGIYQLETRSMQLMSSGHLKEILADPMLLLHFTTFLSSHRIHSMRTLIYYLDALKALRAIAYANGIAEALGPLNGHDFSNTLPEPTVNKALEERAEQAFETLVRDDLPAYVAFTWINVASDYVTKRVTGTLAPHLRESSEGLAEVFCLTDCSRPDNPIIFASEEFARTTQYGMSYSISRNCRFLQGPRTNKHSVSRLAAAAKAGKEHSEVFLNYRRDGSPFMNLLMIAPLHDSSGKIRYYIGAQVDVSGLLRDSTDLEGLRRHVAREEDPIAAKRQDEATEKDDFHALSEMFNAHELSTVREHGGHMHRAHFTDQEDDERRTDLCGTPRPRLLLSDSNSEKLHERAVSLPQSEAETMKSDVLNSGLLQGVYEHYLLVRPAPSLRILFTSRSLHIPGMVQSNFLDRIGGSSRVRLELATALADARCVTAKIRWLTRPNAKDSDRQQGRSRWIHCTPLLNHKGDVGVWMVVLVDSETQRGDAKRAVRTPPAVPAMQKVDSIHKAQVSNATEHHSRGRATNGGEGLGLEMGPGSSTHRSQRSTSTPARARALAGWQGSATARDVGVTTTVQGNVHGTMRAKRGASQNGGIREERLDEGSHASRSIRSEQSR